MARGPIVRVRVGEWIGPGRVHWGAGLTADQLDDVQSKWHVRFPPDLYDLLRERCLEGPNQFHWIKSTDRTIRLTLKWPLISLWFDLRRNSWWWPEWGPFPEDKQQRFELLADGLSSAPTLIPVHSHRYLPATPFERGNPVISMHGSDTIYYGRNLDDYLDHEFGGAPHSSIFEPGPPKRIPFWSDLIDLN